SPVVARPPFSDPITSIPLPSAYFPVLFLHVALPILATTLPGLVEIVEVLALTAPGVNVALAVAVMATPLIVTEMVFASAFVEASFPVVWPLAPVAALRVSSLLPVPVEASTTLPAAIP